MKSCAGAVARPAASESCVRHWHPAGRPPLKLAAPCCFAVAGLLFGPYRLQKVTSGISLAFCSPRPFEAGSSMLFCCGGPVVWTLAAWLPSLFSTGFRKWHPASAFCSPRPFETGSSMLYCCGEPAVWTLAARASFLEASESDVLAFCSPGGPLKLAAPCCFAVASRMFGRWRRGSRACFLQASESDVQHWHPAGRHPF